MTDPQSARFERRARELYLRAGPRIDPATAAELRAARARALAVGTPRRLGWMVPAGACAAAALVAFTLWQPLRGPTVATRAAPVGDTAESAQVLPPDADQTDPALYQNLDFYAWLAQQPATASAGSNR